MRTPVIWHLFQAVHNGDPAPEEALAAAAPNRVAATTAAGRIWPGKISPREMLARARKTPPTKADWVGMIALEKRQEQHLGSGTRTSYAYLTPAELKAIAAISGFEESRAAAARRASQLSA